MKSFFSRNVSMSIQNRLENRKKKKRASMWYEQDRQSAWAIFYSEPWESGEALFLEELESFYERCLKEMDKGESLEGCRYMNGERTVLSNATLGEFLLPEDRIVLDKIFVKFMMNDVKLDSRIYEWKHFATIMSELRHFRLTESYLHNYDEERELNLCRTIREMCTYSTQFLFGGEKRV